MLIRNLLRGLYFDADGGAGSAAADRLETFDAYIEKQPDEIKTLYQQHTTGLQSALTKEREANKQAKADAKRLAELEAQEQARADAAKSETEKLAARVAAFEAERDAAHAERDQAQAELKTERIRNSVIAEAGRLGFADPADAYTLIDLSTVTLGDDGKVTGADAAIKKLAETKPYLLGKAKGDGVGSARTQLTRKKDEQLQNRAPLIRSL